MPIVRGGRVTCVFKTSCVCYVLPVHVPVIVPSMSLCLPWCRYIFLSFVQLVPIRNQLEKSLDQVSQSL